jgi:hypothetical protein
MRMLVNKTSTRLQLSNRAIIRYNELAGTKYTPASILNFWDPISSEYYTKPWLFGFPAILVDGECDDMVIELDVPRTDPILLQIYDELGDDFSVDSYCVIEVDGHYRLCNDDRVEYVEQIDIKYDTELLNMKYKDQLSSIQPDQIIDVVCNWLQDTPDAVKLVYTYPKVS